MTSNAQQFRSHSDVVADIAELRSPKINQCLNAAVKADVSKSLPPGVTIGALALHLSSGSSGGPSDVIGVATGRLSVSSRGRKATVYLLSGFVAGNTTESEIDAESIATPFPESTFHTLLEKLAGRVH